MIEIHNMIFCDGVNILGKKCENDFEWRTSNRGLKYKHERSRSFNASQVKEASKEGWSIGEYQFCPTCKVDKRKAEDVL